MTGFGPADLAQLRLAFGGLGASLTELGGGTWPTLRIDLVDGTSFVLKTYDRFNFSQPAKEAYAVRLLEGLDLPVTRYLLIDQTQTRIPCPYAIASYLPGVNAGSLVDDPEISTIYCQMGAALRKLHTVRLPAYGAFGESGIVDPVESNAEFVRRLATYALAQFRKLGANGQLATRLEQIIEAHLGLADHSTGPVFAHDDLHPRNVLVTRDASGRLQLSGVIDFGNAQAADAVFDLAKTLFFCAREAPGSDRPIRDGYGVIDHPDPVAALWFYTMLHSINFWWWTRETGFIPQWDHDLLTSALTRTAEEGRPRR